MNTIVLLFLGFLGALVWVALVVFAVEFLCGLGELLEMAEQERDI